MWTANWHAWNTSRVRKLWVPGKEKWDWVVRACLNIGRKFIPWSLKVATHPEEERSGTTTESLDKISEWGNAIWKKDTSSLQNHIQFWKRQKPSSRPLHWTGFKTKALQARAVDMKQGSAGPDGWRGVELAELPETIWIDVAAIFNAWVTLRSTPKSLRH